MLSKMSRIILSKMSEVFNQKVSVREGQCLIAQIIDWCGYLKVVKILFFFFVFSFFFFYQKKGSLVSLTMDHHCASLPMPLMGRFWFHKPIVWVHNLIQSLDTEFDCQNHQYKGLTCTSTRTKNAKEILSERLVLTMLTTVNKFKWIKLIDRRMGASSNIHKLQTSCRWCQAMVRQVLRIVKLTQMPHPIVTQDCHDSVPRPQWLRNSHSSHTIHGRRTPNE